MAHLVTFSFLVGLFLFLIAFVMASFEILGLPLKSAPDPGQILVFIKRLKKIFVMKPQISFLLMIAEVLA